MSDSESTTVTFANGIKAVITPSRSDPIRERTVVVENWEGKIHTINEWDEDTLITGPTIVIPKGQSGLVRRGFFITPAPDHHLDACRLFKQDVTDHGFCLLVLVRVTNMFMSYTLKALESA